MKKSLSFLAAFSSISQALAATPGTPEARVKEMSTYLNSISDQQWSQIAGDRTNEMYTITQGDTLYGISERVFGDGNYWPKIWALNNKKILNPHLIYPGKQIAFSSGSGEVLPEMDLTGVPPEAVAQYRSLVPPRVKRKEEWKKLGRQRWETVKLSLPSNIDPDGFDRTNKVRFNLSRGFTLEATTFREIPQSYGVVTQAKQASEFLSLNHKVFIEPGEGEIEIGKSYTVTTSPMQIESKFNGKEVLSYVNLATIRIDAENDGKYVGSVIESNTPFRRGSILIDLMERKKLPKLKEGTEEVEGSMLVIPQNSTYATSQHKQVFIDLGSEDGIEVGHVFRSYQEDDPSTGDEIARQPTVSNANYVVVDVRDDFCTALILNSNEPVENHQRLFLLTDISDLIKTKDTSEKVIEATEPEELDDVDATDELDLDDDADLDDESFEEEPLETEEESVEDLDTLDSGDELNDEEKRELEQLEKWEDKESEEQSDALEEETEDDEAMTAPAPDEDELDVDVEEDAEDILESDDEFDAEDSDDDFDSDSDSDLDSDSDDSLDLDDEDLEIDDAI